VIDPRTAVVEKRLAGVRRVIAVASAKGGVGKTFCTTAAGIALTRAGKTVGILDLDLQGASVHVFLGVTPGFPAEERGILPLPAGPGLSLMSAAAFSGERPLPLRGASVTDALRELLAVTRWGSLDVLLVDMPPGLGEEILDLARLVPRLETVVVSTPARVSVVVVERLLKLLRAMKVPVLGLIANMADSAGDAQGLASRAGVPFLGCVAVDPGLETRVGRPRDIAESPAMVGILAALRAAGLL